MDFSPFPASTPGSRAMLISLWIPLLAPPFLFAFDYFLLPGAFLFPLMLLVLLCFLTSRLSGWMVASWAVVYALAIFALSFLPIQEIQTLPAVRPYLRTAYFLVSSSAVTFLAVNRARAEKNREAIFEVLSALPLPVIISDVSGNIFMLNQAARKLLAFSPTQVTGLSYFSTFMSLENQGRHIEAYTRYFQADHAGPISTRLSTRGASILNLEVTITIVAFHKHRYAITVVERSEIESGVPAMA